MRWRVGITGPHKWALEGVAQALQRCTVPAFDTVVIETPLARQLPPLDALAVVEADAAFVARLAQLLPAQLPLLWLGEAADLARAAPCGQLAGDADDSAVAAALHALASGLDVFDAAHRHRASVAATPAVPAAPLNEPLTPRELEVLELMAKGLANREIALALGISSHTAKFHVAQILEKAGAATRTEAVRQALRLGLIGL